MGHCRDSAGLWFRLTEVLPAIAPSSPSQVSPGCFTIYRYIRWDSILWSVVYICMPGTNSEDGEGLKCFGPSSHEGYLSAIMSCRASGKSDDLQNIHAHVARRKADAHACPRCSSRNCTATFPQSWESDVDFWSLQYVREKIDNELHLPAQKLNAAPTQPHPPKAKHSPPNSAPSDHADSTAQTFHAVLNDRRKEKGEVPSKTTSLPTRGKMSFSLECSIWFRSSSDFV